MWRAFDQHAEESELGGQRAQPIAVQQLGVAEYAWADAEVLAQRRPMERGLRNGTPCIVPRESGVAEVLRHAFKVDFWDVDEMTNKIVALARFPELHEELRERGRREVASPRFSLDEPARRTEDVYRQAIHAHGGVCHA